MIPEGTLFIPAANKLKTTPLRHFPVPEYYPHAMSNDEANHLPWSEFTNRIRVAEKYRTTPTKLELLLTPKTPPWTNKDCNIFIGSPERKIATVLDLTDDEGQVFFDMNFTTALQLIQGSEQSVHVAIGFNEQDNLPGQHSIRERLHSHIYIPSDPELLAKTSLLSFRDMSWFDRMSVIEPLTQLYADYCQYLLLQGLFQDTIQSPSVTMAQGYFSFMLRKNLNIGRTVFPPFKQLYAAMQSKYGDIESLLTNKEVDPNTGRYIPSNQKVREKNVEAFITENCIWLSPLSQELLMYLAKHIKQAVKRTPTTKSISSASHIFLTKGFAGAVNFAFEKDTDTVRVDILPCSLTTSSMNKVLLGYQTPGIVARGQYQATHEDYATMQLYTDALKRILRRYVAEHQDELTLAS